MCQNIRCIFQLISEAKQTALVTVLQPCGCPIDTGQGAPMGDCWQKLLGRVGHLTLPVYQGAPMGACWQKLLGRAGYLTLPVYQVKHPSHLSSRIWQVMGNIIYQCKTDARQQK